MQLCTYSLYAPSPIYTDFKANDIATIFKWICKRNPAALWRRYRDYIQRRRERRENTKDDIEHCRSSPSTASRSPEISLFSQVYASPEKSRPEPVSLLRSIWDRIPFPFNQKGVHYFNTRDERREQARIDREVGYFPSGYASDYVEKGQGQSQGRGRGRQSSSYASGGHSAFSQNYSSIEEPKPVLQQQERVWWRDHPELLGENVLVAIRSIQEEARLKREGKQ